jgi:magnesium chelatase family protein
MAKISGPLLDRIDIHIEVPAVEYKELSSSAAGTSSAEMRAQVEIARQMQARRFANTPARYNARMAHRQLRHHCRLDEAAANLLKNAMSDLGLSARAHDKVLRVSRTIADLEQQEDISSVHIGEAINYRMLDRSLWK